ncbi:hypothetical protein BST61_g7697 [Cercospora zeina]
MATDPANMALFPPTTDAGNNGILQNIIWQGRTIPAYGAIDQATEHFMFHHIPADTEFELCEPDGVIIGTIALIKHDRLLQLLSKDPNIQLGILAKISAAHGNGALSDSAMQSRVRQAFIWMRDRLGPPSVPDVKAEFNTARQKNALTSAGGQATRITYTNEGARD